MVLFFFSFFQRQFPAVFTCGNVIYCLSALLPSLFFHIPPSPLVFQPLTHTHFGDTLARVDNFETFSWCT